MFDELVHNNNTVDNTISNISSDLLHNTPMQKQSEIHMVLVSAIFSTRYSERTWPFEICCFSVFCMMHARVVSTSVSEGL